MTSLNHIVGAVGGKVCPASRTAAFIQVFHGPGRGTCRFLARRWRSTPGVRAGLNPEAKRLAPARFGGSAFPFFLPGPRGNAAHS